MNEQTGYIYLIKAGEHHKIGLSTNVAKRIRHLNLPFPVELLHTIAVPDMGRAEKYLHRRFADQRVHGEWFTLSPDDVAWICSLETIELEPEPAPPAPPAVVAPTPKIAALDLNDLLNIQEAVRHSGLTRQRLYQIKNEVGQDIKGNWYFSKTKLDQYLATERKRGPRPKSESPIPSPVIRLAA